MLTTMNRSHGAAIPGFAGAILFALLLAACSDRAPDLDNDAATGDAARHMTLDAAAESYVRLALAFRRFDGDYVDAYFGPAAWAEATDTRSLDELHAATFALGEALAAHPSLDEPLTAGRHAVLSKRVAAMRLRMEMAAGDFLEFDAESALLFDAVAPDQDLADFDAALARIDTLVPGAGSLPERLAAFRAQFVVPKDRLDAVMRAAIDECRKRTLAHIDLPADEHFTLEFVTDQPWSGYNWYKGGNYSLIQINTDLPIHVDRAVDLGCHEGYPGHHTYNLLIERNLVERNGWIEYTVNPLFGPQSLIAEGTANYGIDMAFPDNERREFERRVIFPLAGIDPDLVDRYYDVERALADLSYAGNEVARDYLNGHIDASTAADQLVTYTLSSPERAAQRVRFIDKYRSYVINYNLGRDLVADYVGRTTGDDESERWRAFEILLASPVAAGDLR